MKAFQIRYSETQRWIRTAMRAMKRQGAQWNFGIRDQLFWATALVGEAGEYANLVKKIERGDKIDKQRLVDELADVAGHCYIIANKMGIDLEEAVKQKQRQTMLRSNMKIPGQLEENKLTYCIDWLDYIYIWLRAIFQ